MSFSSSLRIRGRSVAFALLLGAFAGAATIGVDAQTSDATAATTDTGTSSSNNLDDLFSDGSKDTTATSDGTALAALQTKQPLTFSGSLYCMVGGAVGWSKTPSISDPSSGLGYLVGGSVTNYLNFDARPDPTIRFHGSIEAAFPGFTPKIYELFFDYSMADAVFLRGGRQVIGWGNGRIFDVGDLMDNSSDTLSLKTYVPFGPHGFTLVTMVTDPGSTTDLSTWQPVPEAAPRLDLVLGRFEFSEEATFKYGDANRWASTIKTSLLGMDLYGEVFGSWLPERSFELSSLESAFWQTTDRKFSLYGEHYFDGSDGYDQDHRVALLAALKVQGFTFAAQWIHAFTDGSGSVMPAVTISPFQHLTVVIGLPVSYGATGSIYAGKAPSDFNSPTFNPQNLTNPNLTSPITSWNQRYSLFLKVELSTSY